MNMLKSRQLQIPGGLRFYQPQTKWQPPPYSSFSVIVQGLITHRKANPFLVRQFNLSVDQSAVEMEVDSFNAAICEQMGWTDYITQPSASPPPPKFKALSPIDQRQISVAASTIKKVWQGIKSVSEWAESGEPPVPVQQSTQRAAVCAACPQNGQGGLEEWFTAPASAAIKKLFEKFQHRNLTTPSDEKLNVCKPCLCPLKLLVHAPLKYKLAHMGPETEAALDPGCWVLAEKRALQG
jgi:hypothetical protein